MDELRPELPERSKKAQVPYCVCLAWSADGSTLYSGEPPCRLMGMGVGWGGLRWGAVCTPMPWLRGAVH